MSSCTHYEPTIDEILADSAVKALMRADGVDPTRLRDKLLTLRARRLEAEAPPQRRRPAATAEALPQFA
jgi:hypothetical protein